MIRVRQVSVNVDKSSIEDIKNNTAKKLKINPNDILNLSINKESIDARYKPDLYYIYEVDIEVKNENAILKKNKSNDILKTPMSDVASWRKYSRIYFSNPLYRRILEYFAYIYYNN